MGRSPFLPFPLFLRDNNSLSAGHKNNLCETSAPSASLREDSHAAWLGEAHFCVFCDLASPKAPTVGSV